MSKYAKQVLCAAAVVLAAVATPALAQAPAASSSSMSGYTADAWGNVGVSFYHSTATGGGTTTEFGIHAGGDFGIRLTDSLSGVGIADLAVTFGDQTILPFFIGAGIKLDHTLPVVITAGVGLQVLTGITGATPVGLGILGQAYYPLPMVQNLSVGGQLQVHILSDSLVDFVVAGGVEYHFM